MGAVITILWLEFKFQAQREAFFNLLLNYDVKRTKSKQKGQNWAILKETQNPLRPLRPFQEANHRHPVKINLSEKCLGFIWKDN